MPPTAAARREVEYDGKRTRYTFQPGKNRLAATHPTDPGIPQSQKLTQPRQYRLLRHLSPSVRRVTRRVSRYSACMRVLFIGGTRFVGRAMAEAALQRDHAVTLLHRGQTHSPALDSAEHLRADRDEDLSVLTGREFDATIDVCAYVPRQVRTLADAPDGRGGQHLLVSTMSVYAETDAAGLDESSPLVELDDPATEDVTGETYGGLKVLCERQAQSSHADALTIVRPTYVIGPHDHTTRSRQRHLSGSETCSTPRCERSTRIAPRSTVAASGASRRGRPASAGPPSAATISDTWDWIRAEQPPMVTGWGISSDRESQLLTD
jgi:2'-hydroxyisoflavone reductase